MMPPAQPSLPPEEEDSSAIDQAAIDQAAIAESAANEAMAAVTNVPEPRQRIFLPQSMRERFLGFWWSLARAVLFRTSSPALSRWRVFLLRRFGADVHKSAAIAPTAWIEYPWNLKLGEGVVICDRVIINCMGRVEIGERTRISQYSHICAGTHDYQRRDMKIRRSPITIGKDVWIAADAFVGPGVTVGDGCVLAARSSAFHDLPAGQICVGEPAMPVRARFDGDLRDGAEAKLSRDDVASPKRAER